MRRASTDIYRAAVLVHFFRFAPTAIEQSAASLRTLMDAVELCDAEHENYPGALDSVLRFLVQYGLTLPD